MGKGVSISAYGRFVDAAVAMQGAPYIWGGKGLLQFKDGKLLKHLFVDTDNKSINVFDCSGLVTHAIYVATLGQLDLRGSHSAETMLNTFPECPEDFGDGCLILYPSHVAIDLGRGRVVDANRGGQSTLSLLAAQEHGAKVEIHRTVRPSKSILGYRKIPLTRSELLKK